MSALAEQVAASVKEAMRAGDALKRDTLRMVMADIKNRRIELGRELSEDDVAAVLARSVKTRKESREQYEAAGREELAAREQAEIEVITVFLPEPMGEDELRAAVVEAVAEVGATSRKETGAVMKVLMGRYRGRIDGKRASGVLAEVLDS
ncbi:MAG: GatB/YqeY domain-containing protein [Planctomycetota bacterium]|nr:GatB/YqeY domain-containing protein [Planctomycetota bacterium]MDP6762674.1 GatB/YqeY domain-containing protein [Planctomycetota bacterium]MDP6989983.1 GatB/YqeY domain-containing protein [Planctomycetota bacterium]